MPIIHEKVDQGRKHRLTIKTKTATSGTADLDQSSIRVIETLIKQVLKEQHQSIGQVFYRWDETPSQEGAYDLRVGFRQSLCLTESGPTLNFDTTITRFYPNNCDMLPFIWTRLLGQNINNFKGWIEDNRYYQIENDLKGIEVTTAQSEHQKKYTLTGRFSEHLPGQIPIDGHKNLSAYYKALGYELKNPNLYCLKAYRADKPDNIIDLPIEHCSILDWQMVGDDKNINPVKAPPPHERYASIMKSIQSCDFTSNQLCKEISFQVESKEMMTVPYGVLAPRDVRSGQKGSFLNPVKINRMAFIYLTDRQRQDARAVKDNLLQTFRFVASQQNITLPKNIQMFDFQDHRKLDKELFERLSELKNQQCEFILCLENCQSTQIHSLFKQIATGDLGKLVLLSKIFVMNFTF